MRRWAARNGQDAGKVGLVLAESLALRIIKDLSNNDKHGHPPRDGGHSRTAPRLAEVTRVLRLTTGAETGSGVVVTLGRMGVPVISGSGSAAAVITARVVDKEGNNLGDLFEIQQQGIQAWESLLQDFGV